jgi:hypothetical protein
MAPVANNPRQGSRLAITIMYRDRPTAQTLPLCNPEQHEPVAARKVNKQTTWGGAAALYVGRIHLGSWPDDQRG